MLVIHTFKDASLLSPLAHDLVLGAAPEIRWIGTRIEVRVPLATLRVWGKVARGRVEAMSDRDLREIEATVCTKVFDGGRFPEIVFSGDVAENEVKGTLTMAGRTSPLVVPFVADSGRAKGTMELTPSRWGVKPYSALFGQLKVQDRVRVEFDLPLPPSG